MHVIKVKVPFNWIHLKIYSIDTKCTRHNGIATRKVIYICCVRLKVNRYLSPPVLL